MEPMLVSPLSGPQSPPGGSAAHGHSAAGAYLPGFLLDEAVNSSLSTHGPGAFGFASPAAAGLQAPFGTPARNSALASYSPPGGAAPTSPRQQHNQHQHQQHQHHQQQQQQQASQKKQPPPTAGLWSSASSAKPATPGAGAQGPSHFAASVTSTPMHHAGVGLDASSLRCFSPSDSAAHGADSADGAWVTVFGFPAGSAGYVLHHLSQCGSIQRHQVPPDANWMHVQFQNRLQAKRALAKNGKILGSKFMIGVQPCADRSIIDGEAPAPMAASKSFAAAPAGASFANTPPPPGNHNHNHSHSHSLCSGNMRSLATKRSNASAGGALRENSGIINKAMNYMFGW